MSGPSPQSKKTAQLVLAAVNDLADNKGASVDAICEHIATAYNVPEREFKRYVSKVIDRGIAFGAFRRNNGRILIGDALEKVRSHRRRGRSKSRHHRRRRHRGRSGKRRRRRRRRKSED